MLFSDKLVPYLYRWFFNPLSIKESYFLYREIASAHSAAHIGHLLKFDQDNSIITLP
jgi:hypothetical protein